MGKMLLNSLEQLNVVSISLFARFRGSSGQVSSRKDGDVGILREIDPARKLGLSQLLQLQFSLLPSCPNQLLGGDLLRGRRYATDAL